MRIVPPPIEIGDAEGFDPAKDIFGRKEFGDGLTSLLTNAEDPVTLLLDGEWGSGKSTFLRMWAGSLRIAGVPVVYFDAFENDYVADAFAAIAGEIISASVAQPTKMERFSEKAIEVGKVLLRSGLKLGVKAATLGVLSGSDIEEVGKEIASGASEAEDKLVGELITQKKQRADLADQFRAALADLAGPVKDDARARTPLIVIVDELDRCRPSFALEVIERIKHFFGVKNVHFVLGASRRQLETSVRTAYGRDIDARNYLQKFVTAIYHLMDTSSHRHERVSTKYVAYLTRVMRPDATEAGEAWNESAGYVDALAAKMDLSLRQIDRIFTNLALALAYA